MASQSQATSLALAWASRRSVRHHASSWKWVRASDESNASPFASKVGSPLLRSADAVIAFHSRMIFSSRPGWIRVARARVSV